jgi:hypothetical protein
MHPPRAAGPRQPICSARATMMPAVSPGQAGGGYEIRTREGLHPTRFPILWLCVHGSSAGAVTCARALLGTALNDRERR